MSISIEDFNNNFVMQIRNISAPHIDETGSIPAAVGFNIVCKSNNRVQYFESHITDAEFVSTATAQDLVNYAWNDRKSDINTWASSAINESNLIGYVYTPVSEFTDTSRINLSTYNSNYTTSIVRFEVFPADDPSSWCVGFGIKNTTNDEYMYIDTSIAVTTFAITTAESEIMGDDME